MRDASMLWGNVSGVPQSLVISFTATATPEITNYDTTYLAKFGNYPKVMLLITDGSNELESMAVPVRYKTAGVLTRIAWDLSEAVSGKIILYT